MPAFEGCPNTGSPFRAGIDLYSGVWEVASALVRAGGVGTTRLLLRQREPETYWGLFPGTHPCCSVRAELQSLHRFSF